MQNRWITMDCERWNSYVSNTRHAVMTIFVFIVIHFRVHDMPKTHSWHKMEWLRYQQGFQVSSAPQPLVVIPSLDGFVVCRIAHLHIWLSLKLAVNTRSGDTPHHDWNRPVGRPRTTWMRQIVWVCGTPDSLLSTHELLLRIGQPGGRYDQQPVTRSSEWVLSSERIQLTHQSERISNSPNPEQPRVNCSYFMPFYVLCDFVSYSLLNTGILEYQNTSNRISP